MTPKEYLQQIKIADVRVEQGQARLRELKNLAYGVRSANYTDTRVSSSAKTSGGFENLAAKMADQQEAINQAVDRYVDIKEECIEKIYGIENPLYSQVLYMRYVEYKQLNTIAHELHYSREYVCRVHGWALSEFGRRFL